MKYEGARIYENTYFDTMALSGGHRLVVRGESLEGVKQEIDDAEARARERGCNNPEQWIITKVLVTRAFDMDGLFLYETKTEKRLEIYPEKIS